MDDSGDRCKICGQTRGWHMENKPHHTFVTEADDQGMAQLGPRREKTKDGEKKKPGERKVRIGLPTDPALRVALVNKGILTMADIIAAEEELREAAEHGRGVVVGYSATQPDRPRMEHGDETDLRMGSGGSAEGSMRDPGQA